MLRWIFGIILAGLVLTSARGASGPTTAAVSDSRSASTLPVLATTDDGFLQVLGPRDWSFPRDDGRHDGFKVEWWYFTGNLRDPAGHHVGFQLTFFRTPVTANPTSRPSAWAMNDLFFAHAAVTDVDARTFCCDDLMQRGRPGLAESSDQTLDVSLLGWTARRDDSGSIRLRADGKQFAFDLVCTGGRGPILQGPGGINSKGNHPGQASYYYSRTRMKTGGTVQIAGHELHVEGLTWMDHEFSSNALRPEQAGWDWMGLSLADGSDLMLYRLRNQQGGTDYLSGTLIKPDGTERYLSDKEITLAPSRSWKSPADGAEYPQRWNVSVRGMPALVVQSLLAEQELHTPDSTKVDYFEGAAAVEDEAGRGLGEGYLEMTGYAGSMGSGF